MKKKFILLIIIIFLSLYGCNNKEKVSLENNEVKIFYLDDNLNEIYENTHIRVKNMKKEILLSLNNEKVKVDNLKIDEVGEYIAEISYNNYKVMMPYIVSLRKWDGSSNINWYDENENLYEIKNAKELSGLSKLVNDGNTFEGKTIKLKFDIDLDNKEFIPIGSNKKGEFDKIDKYFCGTFDGNNKKIKNLKITAKLNSKGEHIDYLTSYYHAGLFGYVKNVVVKNLTLENVNIINGMGNNYVYSLQGTGGLIGHANGECILENISLIGKITIKGEYKVGGIIGSASGSKLEIKNSKIIGDENSFVYGTDTDFKDTCNFGGLMGFTSSLKNEITNVVTKINVTGWLSGGLIGSASEGKLLIKNVAVYGNVTLDEGNSIGGLIGSRFVDMNLSDCYFLGELFYKKDDNIKADLMVSSYGNKTSLINSSNLFVVENKNNQVPNSLNSIYLSHDDILLKMDNDLKKLLS